VNRTKIVRRAVERRVEQIAQLPQQGKPAGGYPERTLGLPEKYDQPGSRAKRSQSAVRDGKVSHAASK
jgi:hypothetical protein